MIKNLLPCILMFMPASLFAEANMPEKVETPTFLLKAPGTISGVQAETDTPKAQQAPRFKSSIKAPLKYKNQRFGNRVESFKFPQYGQVHGRYNPWSEEEASRSLPPSLPPANPRFSNPWDLSGRLPAQNPRMYQASPSPNYWSSAPDFGLFRDHQGMNPDFPDAIYRDTNPASTPFSNGVIPGMGRDDFDFPFSPFKMF